MRRVVPLAVGLLAAGCHHAGKQATAPPRAETAVKVQNQNYLDMDVFVVRGGQRIRLGMVTGLSTQLFMLRPEVVGTGTDLQFEFHPIGGRDRYPSALRSKLRYWIASLTCFGASSAAPSRSAIVRAILRIRW